MIASPGYAALTESVAVLPETGRVVFEMRGARARRVANGLLTNTLEGLEAGRARYAFALTAKGRPVAEMRVLPAPGFEDGARGPAGDAETLWIDVPEPAVESLRAHLGRFVPPILATHHVVEIRRFDVTGPAASQIVARVPGVLGLSPAGEVGALGELECASLDDGTGLVGLVVRREDVEGAGIDVYLPSVRAPAAARVLRELVTGHGGAPATPADWDVVRIERGLPAYGREITPDVLPQETGQEERALSFTKGCYTGQEVVARIHYRGHVNRHLRGVEVAPGAPLAPGDTLAADGKEVGTVTSTTRSPRFGTIGLAYVRREVEPGARLATPAGDSATISALPFTST